MQDAVSISHEVRSEFLTAQWRVLARAGLRLLGASGLAVYGLLGLDGVLHYTLALCSEHSLAMNLTIWWEVIAGLVLAAVCLRQLRR